MANGEEGGEMALPTLRVGMKREFAMMKAQSESGVTMTPGRVTRSRLSESGVTITPGRVTRSRLNESGVTITPGRVTRSCLSESGGVTITPGRVTRSRLSALPNGPSPNSYVSSSKLASGKGLNGRKLKKELENVVLNVVKLNGQCDIQNVRHNENIVSKRVLFSKEEQEQERKNEAVCGLFVDDRMGVTFQDDPPIGEGKRVVGLENVGSIPLKNIEEKSSDMGSVGGIEEPVGGIVERVNKRGKVIKENGDCLTPSRRLTRSMLKSSVEASEASRTGDESACKENGNPVKPCRRFTRSSLNTMVNPSKTGDGQSKVIQSDAVNPVLNSPKLEMKMSKKVELKNAPATLEDLLATCLLEGLHVHYAQGSKSGMAGKVLPGEIKGSGILCFCDECKGTQVVTPHQFEMHAGSGKNNPAKFIYLDNGKTLCDVLTGCKGAASDWMERAIQISIGRVNAKEPIGRQGCEGLPKPGTSERMLRKSCTSPIEAQIRPSKFINGSTECSSPTISIEPSSVPTELNDINAGSLPAGSPANSFVNLPSSSQSRSKSHGRLTRKDLRLHRLVFESDMLPDGTQLAYYCHGKKMREGYKSGHGIYCNCCQEVVSASTFEAHAGFASRRKPYMYIYTSNGVSLHELAIEIKKSLIVSTDENDDICSICEGMGELLCCDNCPRSFHKECIELSSIPQDRWYCRYCVNMFQKDSFVASNINAVAAGRIAGIDAFEEIKKRCIRIVETLEPEDGGCVLCRGRDFSKLGFGPRTVIICDQCEKEFHIGCLKEHGMEDLEDLPNEWFCCIECSKMHSALQQHLIDGEKILPDSVLNIVRKKSGSMISEGDHDFKLTWRLLRGKIASEDDRKCLSGAVSVFHDRFDPIGHSSTRRNDLIPFMIYGRSNKHQDFGGMYCAVLLLNSKVVSAGIFRIFGREMAELPLVATSTDCQGKGYFQTLFGCIENLLTSLEVNDLVLPSASEAEEIWRNKFRFENITDEQLNVYRKDYPMTIFQGTSVLHKLVPKPEISPTEANV